MASQAQNAFNAGEFSPLLLDRIDLKKYAAACLTLQNQIITRYGGARRRPGLQYIAAAKGECHLLQFQFNSSIAFVIEAGTNYFRFFVDRRQVVSAGAAYEVVTPFTVAQIKEAHFAQVNDEVRIVHPDVPPQILRRLGTTLTAGTPVNGTLYQIKSIDGGADFTASGATLNAVGEFFVANGVAPTWGTGGKLVSDTNWTLTEIAYTQPPLRDRNIDESLTIQSSALTGTTTLTATGFTFDEDQVGGYYRIIHDREDSSISLEMEGNPGTASDPTRVKGDWEITTSGNWGGTIYLQRRVSGGAWRQHRSWKNPLLNENRRNFSAAGSEFDDEVEYRILFGSDLTGGSEGFVTLDVVNVEEHGVVKLTAVAAGGATATATVVVQVASTNATFLWQEGAWSTYRGFPRTLTLHQSRMYYGGNEAQAQTLWASDIDGYDSFTEEDLRDDDSFRITLGNTRYNAIQWVSTSPKNLLIGTTAAEWSLSSGDEANILTGTSARIKFESGIGSIRVQPIQVDNVVLFVARGGRKLMELVFSFEQDGFITADLSELGEHITNGGLSQITYQFTRDSVVWGITGDGLLVGLTYVRKQDVVGWHRHTTGASGVFESVTSIQNGSQEDEIWCIVKRTINGATVRNIESFYPNMWELQEDATTPEDLVYLDSATLTNFTTASDVVTGLSHLEAETVDILLDGAVTPSKTVLGGSITMADTGTKAIVGLPYTSIVEPMPLEFVTEDGTSQGREKKTHRIVISVYKSSLFKYGVTGAALDRYYSRGIEDVMGTPVPLETIRVEKTISPQWAKKNLVRVVQDLPLPLTVLSIVRKYQVGGKA